MESIEVGDTVFWKRVSSNKSWLRFKSVPRQAVHYGLGKVVDVEDDGTLVVARENDGSIVSVEPCLVVRKNGSKIR
jgi:hypothetical protein